MSEELWTQIQWESWVLVRIAMAMILGSIIGAERELADRPAGLRTHMIVAGSATLLVTLGGVITRHYQLDIGDEPLRADPIRVLEAIIMGVSFLGAGTIIRGGVKEIKGLTTAASLLLSAGVGVCAALSQWILAVGVTLLTFLTLRVLRRVDRRLGDRVARHQESGSQRNHDSKAQKGD